MHYMYTSPSLPAVRQHKQQSSDLQAPKERWSVQERDTETRPTAQQMELSTIVLDLEKM